MQAINRINILKFPALNIVSIAEIQSEPNQRQSDTMRSLHFFLIPHWDPEESTGLMKLVDVYR